MSERQDQFLGHGASEKEAEWCGGAKLETRKQVYSLKKTSGTMIERGQTQECAQELDMMLSVLPRLSLAERLSLLGELRSEDCPVMENLYSVFSSKSLQILHSGVSRLMKSCLIQNLPCDSVNSYPLGPAGK